MKTIKLWAGFWFSDAGEQEVIGELRGKSVFVKLDQQRFRIPLSELQEEGGKAIRGSWCFELMDKLTPLEVERRTEARRNWLD